MATDEIRHVFLGYNVYNRGGGDHDEYNDGNKLWIGVSKR